ncbi:universal stress protein [Desulfovibrio sulfodismutans]|uniref:Universal stress protein n=1 Tax=Desulfolutivibrio sulfodismutans TaxID=63561 RepID=A0A7K3NH16_9BACT|nr:universal stress protein [Desulfolutivibrio sulfodismutans]NDY55494.1 universal stress protein [Desulfolutivibrio sulfodismutans]QLA12882.1 universal stress protein [Desulfolutivibrio sulfodismutans DSM 3696]
MFKDIVLAVTPSSICENAAEKAFSFASRFESKLYLLHVCGMEQGWGAMEHLETSGVVDRIRENMKEYYKERLCKMPNCEVIVVAGISHNEILRVARKKNADLIIMGPHTKEHAEKRSKMWGMAGSTLERVSQRARCPVMIVTRETPGDGDFKNIVAATDLSEQAGCAVAYAGQLARHYKAGLTILNVLESSKIYPSDIRDQIEKTRTRLQGEYGARLEGLKDCSFECAVGDPPMEILDVAQKKKADLVIMAHHSKETDPEKAFLGSTVTKVALNCGCPTMSVNRHFDLRCGMMYDQTGQVVEATSTA